MNVKLAELGKEYIIERIETDDEELDAFLFSLGCYSGEPITVVSHKKRNCVISIKDGRYSIDRELASAILVGASWHQPDHYFVLHDFASYMEQKLQCNRDYRDRISFSKKCLMNVASAGKFSSDRTIRQYADEIWHV